MKKALRLGDVCRQLDLQPYVLRYWETEFPMLQSSEGGGANRVYEVDEIALLRRIKTLLYDEGYTIAGARKKLESEPPGVAGQSPLPLDGQAADASVEAEAQAALLDTSSDQRIEQLKRGVEEALREARAILEGLESRR